MTREALDDIEAGR